MRIFEKQNMPPVIRIDFASNQKGVDRERITLIETSLEDVSQLVKDIAEVATEEKGRDKPKVTITVREYSDQKIGRCRSLTVYGHDPLTMKMVIETRIEQIANETNRTVI